MKYFLAIVSASLAAGCAAAPRPPNTPIPRPATTVASLEREEFARPKDPTVKLALGRAYWCQGQRGHAVEQWKWIRQFAAKSTEAKEADALIRSINDDSDQVEQRLACHSKGE